MTDMQLLVLIIIIRDKDITTNKAPRAYFIPYGNKLRRPPKTTLPTVFNIDIALIQHTIILHSGKDLAEITELKQDRKCWKGLAIASQKEKAAEDLRLRTS